MKKFASLFALVGAVALNASAGLIVYPGVLWSNVSTNLTYNAAVGPTGTNTSAVFTNNVQSGVVINATTNYFNLSSLSPSSFGVSGNQANTNSWPSCAWSLLTSYPNTYAPPANNVSLGFTAYVMATNSTATTITVHWAASNDGNLWVSNYLVETYAIGANSLGGNLQLTNTATGATPWIALQQIDNPGANILTNVVVSATQKPGL